MSEPSPDIPYHSKDTHRTDLFLSHSAEVGIHSILACRLMIGLRKAGELPERKVETFQFTGMS